MIISQSFARDMVIGSLIGAALIYGIFFDRLSENNMITLAYFWLPICVTGAVVWSLAARA